MHNLPLSNNKTKVFDLGAIIININPSLTFKAFEKLLKPSLNKQDCREQILHYFLLFEKGALQQQALIDNINQFLSQNLSTQEFCEIWNLLLLDIPKHRINCLLKLAEKENIYLLSNTNEIHIQAINHYLKKEFNINGIDALFSKCFLSYEMKMRKPDAEIYLQSQKEIGLAAEQLHFFDDTEENAKAAIKSGWSASWVPDAENDKFWDYLSSQ